MAGPIGIAAVRAIRSITCPHCGTKQARARSVIDAGGTIKCKSCKKPIVLDTPKTKRR
jgi:hypothetical protein